MRDSAGDHITDPQLGAGGERQERVLIVHVGHCKVLLDRVVEADLAAFDHVGEQSAVKTFETEPISTTVCSSGVCFPAVECFP